MKSCILEAVAAAIFLETWLFAAQTIPALPARVATHFNWSGVADDSGPAGSLWMLPILSTVLYLGLTATRFMPDRWLNYPVKITDGNRDGVYALGREMLPALKACTLLALFGSEWGAIDGAVHGAMSPYFTTAVFAPVAAIVVILIYYTLKMRAV